MKSSIELGSFSFQTNVLVILAAIAISFAVAKWLSKNRSVDVESILWRSLVIGFVAARLAFVYEFRAGYSQSPMEILDIRDSGWNSQVGFIAAWIYMLVMIWVKPILKKPLLVSFAVGTLLWGVLVSTLNLNAKGDISLEAVSLPSFDGQLVSLSQYHGKPSIVNLWATWCPPCQRELPMLQEAQSERSDINFVFLNQGESSELVQEFLSFKKLPLKNVLIDGHSKASSEFGTRALPTTLLFDAQGNFVDSHLGEISHGKLEEMYVKLGIRG